MPSISEFFSENNNEIADDNEEEEISNNEISNNKLILKIQKTLGNNINKLSSDQIKELCNKLTINSMTKKAYKNMIINKQITKLSDGSIGISVNGEPKGKFKNEKELRIFLSKQITSNSANKIQRSSELYEKILSNNTNKLYQDIKNRDKIIEATASETTKIGNELFKNTQMYKEFLNTSLTVKRDLATNVNNFENRKNSLMDLLNNQGIRSDNDINSLLNRNQEQKNNDALVRALQDAANAQIEIAKNNNRNTEDIIKQLNDANNEKFKALQEASNARIEIANKRNNDLNDQFEDNNKKAKKIADDLFNKIKNLEDANKNKEKTIDGLRDKVEDYENKYRELRKGFEGLTKDAEKAKQIIEDFEAGKNLDNIFNMYTEPCEAGYCWYKTVDGDYLCSGGSHFISQSEMKSAISDGRKAYVRILGLNDHVPDVTGNCLTSGTDKISQERFGRVKKNQGSTFGMVSAQQQGPAQQGYFGAIP